MFNKISYIIFILSFIIIPFVAQGQFLENDLSIEITPSLPGAYEEVSLRATSFSADLNRSEIFWYVNDDVKLSGTGKRELNFKTGALGEISRVKVIVKTSTGGKISRVVTIQPEEVDVLWQAHTYTPPFYKGLSLPSSQALIKLVAFPQIVTSRGVKIADSDLIYTWIQDGVVLGRASGYGKNSVVIESQTLSRARTSVTVSVSSFNGNLEAQKTISIRTQSPFIAFYEKHPLEGIKSESALLKNFVLVDQEIVLRAEPYFFSLDDMQNDELKYRWLLNNKEIPLTGPNPKELTLRQENGISGATDVRLELENFGRLLQSAITSLRINFGFGSRIE